MRKRIFTVLTATALLVSLLTGCGAENTTTQTESNDTSIVEDVEPTEEPSTEEPTEPEETEQPTEIVESTEEPTPEQTEEAETAEPIEEPEETYTYTDMTSTKYASQSVNVRDLPDTSGNKLGGLSASQEVTVTGQCNETSWYRIEYKGGVAYVSNKYLVDEKPVVEEKPAEQTQTSNTQGSGTYTNNWGQTYHMTLEDVKNATSCELGRYITTDEDNHVYYYMIVSHIRDVPGDGYNDVLWSAFDLLQSKGYSKTSGPVEDVETYDNGNWLIQRVHLYGE